MDKCSVLHKGSRENIGPLKIVNVWHLGTYNLETWAVNAKYEEVLQMSLVPRKPVFGVSDQVILKPACSATETNQSLKILHLASIDIILAK